MICNRYENFSYEINWCVKPKMNRNLFSGGEKTLENGSFIENTWIYSIFCLGLRSNFSMANRWMKMLGMLQISKWKELKSFILQRINQNNWIITECRRDGIRLIALNVIYGDAIHQKYNGFDEIIYQSWFTLTFNFSYNR